MGLFSRHGTAHHHARIVTGLLQAQPWVVDELRTYLPTFVKNGLLDTASEGYTLLHGAAGTRLSEGRALVEELLDIGARPTPGRPGSSGLQHTLPITVAASLGYLDRAELLWKVGGVPLDSQPWQWALTLAHAPAEHAPAALNFWHAKGVSPGTGNESGSLLWGLADGRYNPQIRQLCPQVPIDAVDNKGRTSLFLRVREWANLHGEEAWSRNLAAIDWLCEQGASIHSAMPATDKGHTNVIGMAINTIACTSSIHPGQLSRMRRWVKEGADVLHPSRGNQSVLEFFFDKGCPHEVGEQLLDALDLPLSTWASPLPSQGILLGWLHEHLPHRALEVQKRIRALEERAILQEAIEPSPLRSRI
jgi:hypothetical protein